MNDDKLVKEVSNLRKSINFLCFLLVAFALVFCGVKLKKYIDFHSIYSSVIGTDGYYNSDGDWIDSDGTVYPKVSFGTGDTMEEAEEDAERNAIDSRR